MKFVKCTYGGKVTAKCGERKLYDGLLARLGVGRRVGGGSHTALNFRISRLLRSTEAATHYRFVPRRRVLAVAFAARTESETVPESSRKIFQFLLPSYIRLYPIIIVLCTNEVQVCSFRAARDAGAFCVAKAEPYRVHHFPGDEFFRNQSGSRD